jgi:hypothetical protein
MTAIQGRQVPLHTPDAPRPRHYLGLDPGLTGAAVVIADAGAALVSVTVWKPCQRQGRRAWKVSRWTPQAGGELVELVVPQLSEVGACLTHAGAWPGGLEGAVLAAEDLYVDAASPSAALSLGVSLGRLLAPLELRLRVEAKLVKASAWRSAVLRISAYTGREQAKAASLRAMPALVPGLGAALDALGKLDHITDAAGIACWRRQQEGWR